MNLSNLTIPNSLTEIIKVYKQFKHTVFENWCAMHCDELIHAKEKFIQQIKTLNNQDPKYYVRVCIGVVVLSHFSNAKLEECSDILLEKIKAPRELASSQFISRYIAKYCNRVKSTSLFFREQLNNIKSLLATSMHRHHVIYAKNLLINFSIYSVHMIDSCLSIFITVLEKAFRHYSDDVIETASDALNNYFKFTKQKQFPPDLYSNAVKLINEKIKGGIKILTCLIDFFPEHFIDQSEYLMKMANQKEKSQLFLYYNLEIMIVPIQYDSFSKTAKNIVNSVWPATKTAKITIDFIRLLKNIIRKCPDSLTDRIESLIKIISRLLKNPDNTLITHGSDILLLFFQYLPNQFTKYHFKIKKLILKANFTNDFLSVFQTIIKNNDRVWEDLRPDLGYLLNKLYDERKIDIFLKIIPFVPEIPLYCVNELTNKVQYFFNTDNIEILIFVPAAILALSKYQSEENKLSLGKKLFVYALTSESWEIRLSILDAFQPPFPDYLAYPNFLEHFSVFLNDDEYKVKLSALRILSGIATKNPAMIYPMFRGVTLDSLFLCNSSKSMRLRCSASECLPIIFSSVIDLLPIYVPVFLPIFIQYMNHHLSHHVVDERVLEAVKKNTKPVPVYGKPSLGLGSHSSSSFLSNSNQNPHLNSMSGPFYTQSPSFHSSISTGSLSSHKDYSFSESTTNHNSSPSIPDTDVLSQQVTEEQMTFFDRIFAAKISINYIKAIGCICENNFELIRQDLNEINSLFIKTIATTGQKKLLLASLSTLSIITDKLGPLEASKIPDFVTTLIAIGSKLVSSKVHSAIFSILGRIGLIAPTQERETYKFIEMNKESNEYYDFSVPLDDFFIRVVKTNLDLLLDDKGETPLHFQAIKKLAKMFSMCQKSINAQRLFNSFMIRLFTTIHSVSPDEKKVYFELIEFILDCPTEWLQRFTPHFLNMIEEIWEIEKSDELKDLIPKIASSLKDSCAPYIPRLVSILLDELEILSFHSSPQYIKSLSLNTDLSLLVSTSSKSSNLNSNSNMKKNSLRFFNSPFDSSIKKTIQTLTSMSNFTCNFIFIIINKISDVIINSSLSRDTIIAGLDSFRSLVQRFDCSAYSSIIFRTCVHCIELDKSLEYNSYQVLYSLAVSIGEKFQIYIESLKEKNLLDQRLIEIMSKDNYQRNLADFNFIVTDNDFIKRDQQIEKYDFNEKEFKEDIPMSMANGSPEQWKNWMKTFIHYFITNSPVPAINICAPIAQKSFLFGRKIFNAAFLSLWIQLSTETKGKIKTIISLPLNSNSTPMSIVTVLISLIEFTERAHFPIEDRNNFNRTKWAFRAEKPTFALYFAQMDFDSQEEHSTKNIEQIIKAYSQLGMKEELKGMIKLTKNAIQLPEQFETELYKLEKLEKWDEIASLFPRYKSLTTPEKRQTGIIYAHAFYHLKKWPEFEQLISESSQELESPSLVILKCIRAGSAGKNIKEFIKSGFTLLGSQGGPLFTHGFSAISPFIIQSEQLVELYEFFIKHDWSMWKERVENATSNFKAIRPLLHMRIDLLKNVGKDEHHEAVLSYLKMARKGKEWESFEHFFDMHFSRENYDIFTGYEYLHFLWSQGKEEEALKRLDEMISVPKKEPIFAHLYYKKAKWIARKNDSAALLFSNYNFESQSNSIHQENDDENQLKTQLLNQMQEVRNLCKMAKSIRKDHYPTMNLWAWSAMRVFDLGIVEDRDLAAVEAIKGFAHCVNLDVKNSFSDLLQMISVLFRSITIPTVFNKVKKLIYKIDIKQYIKIIPQLIMYKQTSSVLHRRFVMFILKSMLHNYPNAIIFPLLFEKHYSSSKKNKNANNETENKGNDEIISDDKDISDILDQFKLRNLDFFNAADNVLIGLQNACFTFTEFLIEVLNKIINYIRDGDINRMIKYIPRLLERIKNNSCPYDMIVLTKYRDHLRTILSTFTSFMRFVENKANQQHLDAVKKDPIRIKEIFPSGFFNELGKCQNLILNDAFREGKLNLNIVSPNLTGFSFPSLSVFNTFHPDSPIIGISKIVEELRIKTSKQRPKKLKIIGTNGKTYKFLLKGHEDLRLDQRVMQFFDLMNSITSSSATKFAIPQIIITGVTPLSPNVGIIQWVSGCDTMFELISNYRKIKYKGQIKSFDFENNLMWKKIFAISDKYLKLHKNIKMMNLDHDESWRLFDNLRPIQKLEYFNKVCEQTKEMRLDLRDVMWINAHDAESWVRYTINFSKTTALMSIVGYIIGLGDRHPDNIMIQRLSGHVIHIDFGDCFEVTKERDKLAENIPFRLTRNMIASFGPCSIEGSFRKTCEETVSAIRQRREAVMSTLEIFIRDPTTSGGVFETFQNDIGEEQNNLKEKISRISNKINGLDFDNTVPLTVPEQVDALIKSATDTYNLSYLYHGWNPFW